MFKLKIIVVILITCLVLSACDSAMTTQQMETYITSKKQYLEGDLDKALSTIRTKKFSTSKGHQGLLLEAKILFLQGNSTQAEKILIKLLKKNKGYTEAQIWLTRAQLAGKNTSGALKTIESAMEFNPEDPRLLALMGSIKDIEKDYQQALDYHTRATLYEEDIARSEIALAQLYYQFGQDDQAILHITKAQQLVSDKSVLQRPLKEMVKRLETGSNNEQ